MMQNQTNNGSEEPISFDAVGYVSPGVNPFSNIERLVKKWLSGDARKVAESSDDISNVLFEAASLIRVVGDVMQGDPKQRVCTDQDVSSALFCVASLVELGSKATDAQSEAAYLVRQAGAGK